MKTLTSLFVAAAILATPVVSLAGHFDRGYGPTVPNRLAQRAHTIEVAASDAYYQAERMYQHGYHIDHYTLKSLKRLAHRARSFHRRVERSYLSDRIYREFASLHNLADDVVSAVMHQGLGYRLNRQLQVVIQEVHRIDRFFNGSGYSGGYACTYDSSGYNSGGSYGYDDRGYGNGNYGNYRGRGSRGHGSSGGHVNARPRR